MYKSLLVRTRRFALASLCLAGAVAGTQSARAENVDVSITLNGVTILYYYNSIAVTVGSADLGGLLTTGIAGCVAAGSAPNTYTSCSAGASPALTATNSAGKLVTVNATSPAGATTFNGSTTLTLQNVWAVRAIGGNTANTTVASAVGTKAQLNNGAASIAITSAQIQSGALGPAASITFPDPGLSNATSGDIVLGLNLANATLAGTYANPGGNYTITVTGT